MENLQNQNLACSTTLANPNTEHSNTSQSRFVPPEGNYVQFSNLGNQRTNINLEQQQQQQQMNKKGNFL